MLSYWDMTVRLAAALIFGGALGYERSLSGKAAGMRTHMLVALASAVFMTVSVEFPLCQRWETPNFFRGVDPSKVAAGVVVGIGFIGAGAIYKRDSGVHGLATAADLWLITAVGLAAGGGLYFAAVLGTVLALFVLTALRYVEKKGRAARDQRRRVLIDMESAKFDAGLIRSRSLGAGVRVEKVDYDRDLSAGRTRLACSVACRPSVADDAILTALDGLPGLLRVTIRHRKSRD